MSHREPHFDGKDYCQCSDKCCLGSEGRCICHDCPCAAIGKCEATEGPCPRCRPFPVIA